MGLITYTMPQSYAAKAYVDQSAVATTRQYDEDEIKACLEQNGYIVVKAAEVKPLHSAAVATYGYGQTYVTSDYLQYIEASARRGAWQFVESEIPVAAFRKREGFPAAQWRLGETLHYDEKLYVAAQAFLIVPAKPVWDWELIKRLVSAGI